MEIKSVEKLTNEKWVNLFAAEYEHKGETGRWLFASRKPAAHQPVGPAGDAVIIAPILLADGHPPRLVLEKEFRIPVGDYVIGFPAGLLEPGESVEDAVRREILEETGFEVVRFKRITQGLYASSGLTDEAAAVAFIDVRAVDGGRPKLEASEDIEVILLEFPEVSRLCDDSTARIDARVWMVLYLYQQLGRLE